MDDTNTHRAEHSRTRTPQGHETRTHRSDGSQPGRLLLAGALLSGLLAALAVPAAGDVRSLVAATIPGGPLEPLIVSVATHGLWLLVAMAAVLGCALFVTRQWNRLADFSATAIAACLAYASSELLKLLSAAPRPCQGREIVTALTCPPDGDWSWPSNHAVIATAIAAVILVAGGRLLGTVATLAAVVIALARVAVGVHHPHDSFSGIALALVWAWLATVTMTHLRSRLAAGKELAR